MIKLHTHRYYLKPLIDKGCYGWLYRCYPEPWQVIFQVPGQEGTYTVIETFEARPDYKVAMAMVVQEGARRRQ